MAHVPHLLLEGPWSEDVLPLDRERQHHLGRVLRLSDGEPVQYTDGAGAVGSGTYEGAVVRRGQELVLDRPDALVVAVAPLRAKDRMRFLVEKLVEVGVTEIRWLGSAHAQARPPADERVRAWAAGALEQSRSAWMPVISETTWDELAESPLPLYVMDGSAERGTLTAPCVVVVGPEGGFSLDEIPVGSQIVRLTDTVLRTETAAVVAAALARLGT